MTKRRRERDRPKAGPEAAYNPNKRLLLSYDSDGAQEESVEPETNIGHPAAVDATTADYQIEEYPEEEESEPQGASENGGEAVAAEEGEEPEEELVPRVVEFQPKRRDAKNSLGASRITGQFPALGSLSYQYDEDEAGEEEYGSGEDEAMAYLRAVRSERQALPTFFSSSKEDLDQQLYENGIGDSRGHFGEDCYISAPDPVPATCAAPNIAPQEAYTSALRQRFLEQRTQLHLPASEASVAALSQQHPILYKPASIKQYTQWTRLLNTIAPLPAQIRCMSQETCFNLLELLSTMYLTRESDIRPVTSAWVWSLLARLDDVGTMNNDQVYPLREFGKKAVLAQLSFSDPEAARQLEAISTADGDAVTGSGRPAAESEPMEDAAEDEAQKKNGSGKMTPERENTLATLDMILTVIGEIFGQKDLLEFRQQWQAAPADTDVEDACP